MQTEDFPILENRIAFKKQFSRSPSCNKNHSLTSGKPVLIAGRLFKILFFFRLPRNNWKSLLKMPPQSQKAVKRNLCHCLFLRTLSNRRVHDDSKYYTYNPWRSSEARSCSGGAFFARETRSTKLHSVLGEPLLPSHPALRTHLRHHVAQGTCVMAITLGRRRASRGVLRAGCWGFLEEARDSHGSCPSSLLCFVDGRC